VYIRPRIDSTQVITYKEPLHGVTFELCCSYIRLVHEKRVLPKRAPLKYRRQPPGQRKFAENQEKPPFDVKHEEENAA
jgi:hypothetical protein